MIYICPHCERKFNYEIGGFWKQFFGMIADTFCPYCGMCVNNMKLRTTEESRIGYTRTWDTCDNETVYITKKRLLKKH